MKELNYNEVENNDSIVIAEEFKDRTGIHADYFRVVKYVGSFIYLVKIN